MTEKESDKTRAEGPPPVEAVLQRESDAAFQRVFDELRAIAQLHMRRQEPGHTLQATALVNEAYLRLAAGHAQFSDRGHFVALASRAMRQILVDHARRRGAGTRIPKSLCVGLDAAIDAYAADGADLGALHSALERLERLDPDLGRLVELRTFGGQTIAACADVLGISERQAYRRWQAARAFLHREIEADARSLKPSDTESPSSGTPESEAPKRS